MAVRPHAGNLIAAAAVAGAVALAGCGTAPAPGSGQAGSRSPVRAKVSLAFTVTNAGQAPKRWTLTCDPPGGSHPDPVAACRVLLAMKEPFAPRAKHVMCPMIMLSDRAIKVTGTWFGTPVKRTIVDGSCDVNLFKKILQISP